MRLTVVLLTLFALLPGRSAAQPSCENGSAHAFLTLTTTATSGEGCSVVLEPTVTIVSVVAQPHVDMTKVRFSIQDPQFGLIASATWNYPFIGTPQNGVEITLPECTSDFATTLGQMVVVTTDAAAVMGGCVPWRIDDFPEIEDCDGVTRPALARDHQFSTAPGCCFYIDCTALPPYAIFPTDGATNVPIDATLTWGDGYGYFNLEISTEPECYTGQEFFFQDAHTFTPDFLEHGTTYYWAVGWSDGVECGGASPRYSFTTAGPVPTEPATWGRIKALYR